MLSITVPLQQYAPRPCYLLPPSVSRGAAVAHASSVRRAVRDDPSESHDVAASQPAKLKALLARFDELKQSEVTLEEARLCPGPFPDGCVANLGSGVWAPWVDLKTDDGSAHAGGEAAEPVETTSTFYWQMPGGGMSQSEAGFSWYTRVFSLWQESHPVPADFQMGMGGTCKTGMLSRSAFKPCGCR